MSADGRKTLRFQMLFHSVAFTDTDATAPARFRVSVLSLPAQTRARLPIRISAVMFFAAKPPKSPCTVASFQKK